MKPTRLLSEDDAVSPVIGVVLMVAITVILATVIGAFVLDFGPGDNSAPSANWDVTEEPGWHDGHEGTLVFTHRGGEDVDGAHLEAGANVDSFNDSASTPSTVSDHVFGVGDELAVDVSSDSAGDEVTVVYRQSDSSAIVATHTLSSNW